MKSTVFNQFHSLIPVSIWNRLYAIQCSQPFSCVWLA